MIQEVGPSINSITPSKKNHKSLGCEVILNDETENAEAEETATKP